MQRERRFHQRFLVDFQFQVTVNEVTFTSTALNISDNGIQMECSSECVTQFFKCPSIPATCQICIMLPDSNEPLEIQCRLIVSRRLSQLRYVMGLKFVGLTQEQRIKIVDNLIPKPRGNS